jgi:hypothetical protein
VTSNKSPRRNAKAASVSLEHGLEANRLTHGLIFQMSVIIYGQAGYNCRI